MNHRDAKRLMLGGLALSLVAMVANWSLGGTGGLVWLVLFAMGAIACLIALVFFVMHPIRRRG